MISDNVLGADNQQERLSKRKLTPDYVVGIIDGEGYFSVSVTRDFSKTYKSLRMKLVFGVKLKESDGHVLHSLRDFFGCGSVFKRIDKRPTFSNCLEYQVRKYNDIKTKIIPFFQKHPLFFESKRYTFERFMELADCFESKIHLKEDGFNRVKILSKQMHR